jgi:hypothetical protein
LEMQALEAKKFLVEQTAEQAAKDSEQHARQ